MNVRIRAREVRLIDEAGGQIGVVPLRGALAQARERGLDLGEVAAGAAPPVCRLLDWGRVRYQEARRGRQTRRQGRAVPTKDGPAQAEDRRARPGHEGAGGREVPGRGRA